MESSRRMRLSPRVTLARQAWTDTRCAYPTQFLSAPGESSGDGRPWTRFESSQPSGRLDCYYIACARQHCLLADTCCHASARVLNMKLLNSVACFTTRLVSCYKWCLPGARAGARRPEPRSSPWASDRLAVALSFGVRAPRRARTVLTAAALRPLRFVARSVQVVVIHRRGRAVRPGVA